jgi:hypothetical protein
MQKSGVTGEMLVGMWERECVGRDGSDQGLKSMGGAS